LQASFVIKTQLQTPHHLTGTPPLTKVFINTTYANEVPEQHDAEKLRGIVNCVISDVRETADKGVPGRDPAVASLMLTSGSTAGKPSLVIDATLAPSLIQQCKRDKSYKQWLIQVILEKVEERMGVELSRSKQCACVSLRFDAYRSLEDYTEPNIKCKGTLEPRKAVIPMDEETFERIMAAKAKEKGLERIQLLDDDALPARTTGKDEAGSKAEIAKTTKSSPKKTAAAESGAPVKQDSTIRTPKHEFQIIQATDKTSRSSFTMTIALPDEVSNVHQ
jgi:hypothetical protein